MIQQLTTLHSDIEFVKAVLVVIAGILGIIAIELALFKADDD